MLLLPNLTKREYQILAALLDGGLTNKEIGQRVGLVEKTVKWHMTHIMRKYGVETRLKLVLKVANLDALPKGLTE